MTGLDVAVYAVIGLIGSFFSGMLGVGGAIVSYPLLYFIPPLFGAYAMSPNEISATTMLQVFAASGIGMLMYRKSPWFSKTAVGFIGSGMLVGSLTGSLLSDQMPGIIIHLLYGCMALLAVGLMLRKQQGTLDEEEPPEQLTFHKQLGFGLAMLVGILSGIVGAGGSFLLIPLMVSVLKLPMRTAIASSLTIVFLSSIGGSIGKIAGGNLHVGLTLCLVATSLGGAMLGAKVGQRLNVQMLRLVLSLILLITALNIWGELIWHLWNS